ncbi:LCP family protein [Streptomyces sp. NRRL F-5630]|uniref:LCP family protein n=1 Tax=Streptomyces sp. NRRL F-5630 TaxID=1463864 RepID=UPI000AD8C4C4|nr:LCP family protein [Streptomyces sp. NRRL F-5630]
MTGDTASGKLPGLGPGESVRAGEPAPGPAPGEASGTPGVPEPDPEGIPGPAADGSVPETATDRAAEAANAPAPAAANEAAADSAPDAASPAPAAASTVPAPPRKRRRARRVLAWTALSLAVVIAGTATAGYLYYQHLNDNIVKAELTPVAPEKRPPAPTPNTAGQTPLNILVIGSDSRNTKENLELGGAKETVGGKPLADVQMLVHVSADRSNMSVVSMPRDTLLKLPECEDPDTGEVYQATTTRRMTNETLGRGGPGCTVATWEATTGIHIDHFMLVDFSGVVSMADAVGGVPVCVDRNIYSHTSTGKGSGLKLEKGTHPVKGEQALQWLRTRYGFGDGTDIGRAQAQHMYMSAMVRQLRENATLANPGKLRSLAEAATKALTVDDGLGSVKKIYDLSNDLRAVPPERITLTTMPFVYEGPRVAPKAGDAEQLWRLVREDIALDGKDKKKPKVKDISDQAAAPGEVEVSVRNATATDQLALVPGRAGTIAERLAAEDFTRTTADQANTGSEDKTEVRYPGGDAEADAQSVAKALKIPLRRVKESADVTGVTVVIGSDWREGTRFPKKDDEDDDALPKSAQALNGADDTACMKVDPAYSW